MIAAIRPSRPAPDACISSAAVADEAHGVGEVERAGGDERRVLAHRVAGGEGRRRDVDAELAQRARTASR